MTKQGQRDIADRIAARHGYPKLIIFEGEHALTDAELEALGLRADTAPTVDVLAQAVHARGYRVARADRCGVQMVAWIARIAASAPAPAEMISGATTLQDLETLRARFDIAHIEIWFESTTCAALLRRQTPAGPRHGAGRGPTLSAALAAAFADLLHPEPTP